MLLKQKETGDLVEILDVDGLVNPMSDKIDGQSQSGQNEQPPESFEKRTLSFPSGEDLPRCWVDADYRKGAAPE